MVVNIGLNLNSLKLIIADRSLLWKRRDPLIPVLLEVGIIEAARVLKDHIIGLDDSLQFLVLVCHSIGLSDGRYSVYGSARPSSSHHRQARLCIFFIALKVIRVVIVIILVGFNIVSACACQFALFVRIDSADRLVIRVNGLIGIAVSL